VDLLYLQHAFTYIKTFKKNIKNIAKESK